MLRPWSNNPGPTLAAFGAVSLLLACSSVGSPEATESNGSTSFTTGNVDGTGNPQTLTGETSDTPTTGTPTTFESTTEPVTSTTITTSSDPTTVTGTDGDTTVASGMSSTGPADTSSTASTDTGSDTSSTSSASSSSTGPDDPCLDGMLNNDETDVDCGGSCTPCDDAQICLVDPDCISLSCVDGFCAPASCEDGKINGGETDVDCGGDCDANCLEGELCSIGDDCESGVCDADICVAPACDDGVKNGDETDKDCGGACDACGDGLACALPDDCTSGVCTNDVCAKATCSDAVQNGDETGVDCGGPTCSPCQLMNLIINEVDYDTVGTDNTNAEFIEIYNLTGATVNLQNIAVVLVNGNGNAVYATISLAGAGSLDNGKYLLIAPPLFVAPPGVAKVNFAGAADQIQNGAPDGIALIDTAAKTLLDALSYEGAMTMANIPALGGVVSLVEGTALKATTADSNDNPGSLSRLPNGIDENNAITDWAFSKNPTPGAPNLP